MIQVYNDMVKNGHVDVSYRLGSMKFSRMALCRWGVAYTRPGTRDLIVTRLRMFPSGPPPCLENIEIVCLVEELRSIEIVCLVEELR